MKKEIIISTIIIVLLVSTLFVSVPFFILSCALVCVFILMIMHQSEFLKIATVVMLVVWAGYITQNLI